MRVVLLTLTVVAGPAWGQGTQTCVDVRIGEQSSYGCVNDAMAHLTEQAHGPQVTATLGATSPAPAVGTFNRTATAERMGNNFGHSAFPQRPAPAVYGSPLFTPR